VPHDELPEYIRRVLPSLPHNADRRTLASMITRLIYPLSPRSMETWPLDWRRVNKHSVAPTEQALTRAWRIYCAAPVTRVGQPGSRRPPQLAEAAMVRHNDAVDEGSNPRPAGPQLAANPAPSTPSGADGRKSSRSFASPTPGSRMAWSSTACTASDAPVSERRRRP
jgi:hypothetical protein